MYEYLAEQDITDIITSDDGVRYEMPPAEYNYEGPENRQQVLDMVKKSAARVVSSYTVLVTEAIGRTWYRLTKA